MEGKARFILAATMSSMMVLMVTLIVTCLNLGLRSDFILQWAKAYIIAWPIAAIDWPTWSCRWRGASPTASSTRIDGAA